MPRLSTTGSAGMGVGSAPISIDGSVPAALASYTGGVAGWLNTDELLISATDGSAWKLYSYSVSGLSVSVEDSQAANDAKCGNNRWAAFLAGQGTRTNVGGLGPFPLASVGDVSSQGLIALFTNPQIGVGVSVYSGTSLLYSAQVPLASAAMRCRDGTLAYQTMAGWQLINLAGGQTVSGFLPRANISSITPFAVGAVVWILEYETTSNQFSIRPAGGGSGWTLPVSATMFNVDVIGLGSSALLAWSTTSGEAAADLETLSINLTTGVTVLSTVMAGSLVPGVGPTLPSAVFPGSNAAAVRLPVQSMKAVYIDGPHKGELTKPWRDALQGGVNGVQSAQTSVANLPTPVPPDGFSGVGGVFAPGSNSTLTFKSNDNSMTITPDQPSLSVDFSVVGISFYMSPLTTGGDPTTAELIFGPDGDVVMVPVAF